MRSIYIHGTLLNIQSVSFWSWQNHRWTRHTRGFQRPVNIGASHLRKERIFAWSRANVIAKRAGGDNDTAKRIRHRVSSLPELSPNRTNRESVTKSLCIETTETKDQFRRSFAGKIVAPVEAPARIFEQRKSHRSRGKSLSLRHKNAKWSQNV